MLADRYGNPLSTASPAARDAYVAGVDLLLSANAGAEDAFRRALAADEGFAVAQAGLARTLQVHARVPEAKAATARARELAAGTSPREASHVAALAEVIEKGGDAALAKVRGHLADYPRDAMVLAPCTGVFGLIGFSGRAGRERELLALLDGFADAYGEDWWFASVHAFALVETGEVDRALAAIERSLAQYDRNAHGAHIRAHVYYESGERAAGLRYLRDWWTPYEKEGQLHCHLSWHVALWELELGHPDAAWEVYAAHLHPGASWGPPINTLTDAASFLFRAELAGEPRRPDLWRQVSQYAARWFAAPGVNFADVHAALAHAFAGDADALARLIAGAKGPAADLLAPLAQAFDALSRSAWAEAAATLAPMMDAHERIGGSRAQRDLIEYARLVCLLRLGRNAEARRLLQTRRPRTAARDVPVRDL
jgi:hypothetical protein